MKNRQKNYREGKTLLSAWLPSEIAREIRVAAAARGVRTNVLIQQMWSLTKRAFANEEQ
jgi:hypothetical protein